METIDFCRKSYLSAKHYLSHLRDQELGRVVIRIRAINRIGNKKFQLYLAKRTPYVESIILCVRSFNFNERIILSEDDVLEYNEQQMFIVIKVDDRITTILSQVNTNEVTIESDLTFIVESVMKWYEFHHQKVKFPCNPTLNGEVSYPDNASDEQIKAIESVLSSPVSYVWGAPGTGKTQFVLANCISQYIDLGKRVLLVAPTNNALEQSLRGIIKILDSKGIDRQKVIRLGRATSEFVYEYPEVCQTGYYDRLIESQSRDIDKLLKRKTKQDKKIAFLDFYSSFQNLFELHAEITNRIDFLQNEITQSRKSIVECQALLDEKQNSYEDLKNQKRTINRRIEKQNRYYLVTENFQEFCEIVRKFDERIERSNQMLFELNDKKAEVMSICNQKQRILSEKRKLLYERQKFSKKLSIKLRFFFKRKEKAEFYDGIFALTSEIENLSREIEHLNLSERELSTRIKAIKENISTENAAKNNNPDFNRIAKDVFNKLLSFESLQKKFLNELAAFSDFIPDETIEQKLRPLSDALNQNNQLIIELQEQLGMLDQTIKKFEETLSNELNDLQNVDNDLNTLGAKFYGNSYDFDDLLVKIQTDISDYEEVEIDGDIDAIIKYKQEAYQNLTLKLKDFLENRLLIACTIDYATIHYRSICNELLSDICHLFVDEAAYCPLIKAGVLFSFGIPVALCGDHMQLPPICEIDRNGILNKKEHHDIFLWDMSALYFTEIFRSDICFDDLHSMYVEELSPSFENINVSFLKKTFRFGTQLAAVLDKYIYKNGFHGNDGVVTKIEIIDAPRNTNEKDLRESHSELQAIKQYLETHNPQDYVILAPYKKQCSLIEKELDLPQGTVNTIHAAQGREWDTVIISVTDSHRKFFMSSNIKKSNGLKIVNTAVSRAKKKLVLVLDYEMWKNAKCELLTDIAEVNL